MKSENVLSCSVMSNFLRPHGSSVHGILHVRILEWVAISFSTDLPDPGIELRSPALQADSLLPEPPRKPQRLNVHYYIIIVIISDCENYKILQGNKKALM